jgi:hypothetical protein
MGSRNNNWRGGRVVTQHGYVLIRQPGHSRADCRGYVYEHILVAEKKFGRPILRGEQVHHIDHNPSNNDPANLEVMASLAAHRLEHRKRSDLRLLDEPNPTIACECGCGAMFAKYDATNRPRRFISGHNIHKAPQVSAYHPTDDMIPGDLRIREFPL